MEHSLGRRIAELRKARGLTQAELAKRLNVSDKAISKWETETGWPDLGNLEELSKVFGVSIDYLLKGDQAPSCDSTDTSRADIFILQKQVIDSLLVKGILDIEKLIATRNLDLIQKALEEHPIHPLEVISKDIMVLLQAFREQNWRLLFEYAIDNKLERMAQNIIKHDKDELSKDIRGIESKYIRDNADTPVLSNRKYCSPKISRSYSTFDTEHDSIEKILTYIKECKDQILSTVSSQSDTETRGT